MSVGASFTGVIEKLKVAESVPPCPSETVKTKVPISVVSSLTFALGVKVIISN